MVTVGGLPEGRPAGGLDLVSCGGRRCAETLQPVARGRRRAAPASLPCAPAWRDAEPLARRFGLGERRARSPGRRRARPRRRSRGRRRTRCEAPPSLACSRELQPLVPQRPRSWRAPRGSVPVDRRDGPRETRPGLAASPRDGLGLDRVWLVVPLSGPAPIVRRTRRARRATDGSNRRVRDRRARSSSRRSRRPPWRCHAPDGLVRGAQGADHMRGTPPARTRGPRARA